MHRIGKFGKLLLAREQVYSATRRHFHVVDGGLAAQEWVRTIRIRSGFVAFHFHGRREVVVFDLQVHPLRDGPDPLVPVRRHHVAHFHLALHRVAVHHAVKFQVGTAAINVVAVHGAIAREPDGVLLVDRAAQLLERTPFSRAWRRFAKERLEHHRRERAVPLVGQVDAVNGKRRFGLRISALGRREKVHERHRGVLRHFRHCIGVKLEIRIDRGGVGEIRVGVFLRRDG